MHKQAGCYTTKEINEAMKKTPEFAIELLTVMLRYWKKDWGDLCEEDKKLNDLSVKTKDRILAAYNTSQGRVYVITDAGHEITTVLFAHEY